MRRWMAALAVLCLSSTALAEEMTYGDAIAGSKVPLSIQAKDLNADWRKVTATGQSDASGTSNWLQSLYSSLAGASTGGYFTQGKTITVGGETFMVAYRPEPAAVDMTTLMKSGSASDAMKPKPIKPDTPLLLALLNVRSLGNLIDIRPFDAARDLNPAGPAPSQDDANERSRSRLRQLGLAVAMYTQDYDNVLPPMKSPPRFEMAVYPYVKDREIFQDPRTGAPYGMNAHLSQHKLRSIASPASMVLLFEVAPAPDETRGVAFVDGHVKRIRETEWPRLKKACKIP